MALEQQMEMNFGNVPDNTIGVDPVSGNEIPLGSNAENVRDDIPANLSEGEIVIPADVVNFHGVKLFEDLRAEAKMGYAQMAQDGRMGGEPMMDEDMDIEITIEDLDVMDDEEPVAMSKGGMNVERGRGSIYKSYSAPGTRKPPTVRDIRGGSLTGRKRKPPVKPAVKPAAPTPAPTNVAAVDPNAGMSSADYLKSNVGKGGDSFTGPGVEVAGLNNIPAGMSIAQYTGFADFNTMDDNIEKRVKKKDDEPFFTTNPDGKNRYEEYIAPNLGKLNPFNYFDEGGLVNPEPFYSQKGGFDLSSVNTAVVEYMNDEGHRIFITFVDGVPQMEIPEGYYPAGDAVSIDDVVNYTIPTMDGISSEPVQSSSSKRDKPSTPAPTPINYKELSLEELKAMIADQRTMGSKIFAGLSPITKLIMWDKTRRTKAEIERRIADPATSEVDKMRLNSLLELINREEPGLVKTLLDKVQGKEFERIVSQIPTPVRPDVDYSDPTLAPNQNIAQPYTPDPQESSQMQLTGFEGMGPSPDEGQPITTPGVDAEIPGVPLTRAQIEAAKQIAKEAAANAFSKPEEEPEPQPAPQTQVQQMRTTQQDNKEKKKQKARDRSKAFSLASKKTGDSIAKIGRTVAPSNERTNIDYGDPRRGMMSKGGMVKKKKSKNKKSK